MAEVEPKVTRRRTGRVAEVAKPCWSQASEAGGRIRSEQKPAEDNPPKHLPAQPAVTAPEGARAGAVTPEVKPAVAKPSGEAGGSRRKLRSRRWPSPEAGQVSAGGRLHAELLGGRGGRSTRRGQSRKAVAPLEQAIAVKADGDEALVVLANCWLDRGNMQKALAFAQQAVQANPGNAEAYLVVGAVEQQNDHLGDARNAYEKYLKLAPKGQYAGDIRSILKTLK